MESGRRTQLVVYLVLIALNLLVLPNWFSPGRFSLAARLVLATLNIVIIVLCAMKVGQFFGVNPFSRRRPRSIPRYDVDDEEDDGEDDVARGLRERRAQRRAAAEEPRHFGQSDAFVEFDPYDDAPDPVEEPRRIDGGRRGDLGRQWGAGEGDDPHDPGPPSA